MRSRRTGIAVAASVLSLVTVLGMSGKGQLLAAGPPDAVEVPILAAMKMTPRATNEKATRLVGPLLLTDREADITERYLKITRNAAVDIEALEADPRVISVNWDLDVNTPQLVVWLGPSTPDAFLASYRAKFRDVVVSIRRASFTNDAYLATYDMLQSSIYGRDSSEVLVSGKSRGYRISRDTDSALSELRSQLGKLKVQPIRFRTNLGSPTFEPRIVVEVEESELVRVPQLPASLQALIAFDRAVPHFKAQATPAWPGGSSTFSGRVETSNSIIRGGKQIPSLGCSTGPVVRDQFNVDFVMTAGHCSEPGTSSGPFAVGGGSISRNVTCDTDVPGSIGTTCPPNTPLGVDVALMSINAGSTATGWFVHQAWPGDTGIQQTSYTAATDGSFDLTPGLHLICLEGASPAKFGTNISASSTCGISQGFDSGGFYKFTLYPRQPVCQGDSGAYIRRPTGTGSAWNAGILSYVATATPPSTGGCYMRTGDTSAPIDVGLTTFWKAHLYVQYATGRSVWSKTW